MSFIGGYNQVYTPRVFVRALNAFSQDIIDNIVSFEYQEDPHKMDMVTLTVSNPDFIFSDDPRFVAGIGYDLRWGYDYDLSEIKKLVIARALCTFPDGSGMPSIKLEAGGFQKLMNLTGVPRNYGAVSSSSIAADIAKRYGFNPKVTDSKDARKQHRVQAADMTDFQFLSGLARKLNWEFFIEDDNLYFQPFQFDKAPSADLVFSYRQDATGTLLSFEPSDDKKPGRVGVNAADPKKGVAQKAEAAVPQVSFSATKEGQIGLLGLVDTPEGRAALLPSGNTRPNSPTKVQGKVLGFPTAEDADTLLIAGSEALSSQLRLGVKKATATFIGSPRIRARKVVRLYNLGPYSGNWLITATTHRITADNGYIVTATMSKASDKDADGKNKKAVAAATENAPPVVQFAVDSEGKKVSLLGLSTSPEERAAFLKH